MNSGILLAVLAFIILAAILLWYVIGARGQWWIKLILIAAVPYFSIAILLAMTSYLGWPTPRDPPDKFVLLWAEIREPDRSISDPGAIYVWLLPYGENSDSSKGPFDYQPSQNEPRAYKMPYTRRFHEMLEQAKGLIKQGKRVVVERGKSGIGDGSGDTDREGRRGQDNLLPEKNERGDSGQEQDYRFYELPKPRVQKKHQ